MKLLSQNQIDMCWKSLEGKSPAIACMDFGEYRTPEDRGLIMKHWYDHDDEFQYRIDWRATFLMLVLAAEEELG